MESFEEIYSLYFKDIYRYVLSLSLIHISEPTRP